MTAAAAAMAGRARGTAGNRVWVQRGRSCSNATWPGVSKNINAATGRRLLAGGAGPRRFSSRRSVGNDCLPPPSVEAWPTSPGRVDFSYRKPSRRSSVAGDVILPSLRQPLPKVAMVLDTSGSMDDHLLAQSLAEVEGVLLGLGVGRRHLKIVCCDAKAFEAQKVMRARDVELLGGGGTDMGAGLTKAAELRPRPDLIVVLTDGHTPWPAEPPGAFG